MKNAVTPYHDTINANPDKFAIDDVTLNTAISKVFLWTFFGLGLSATMSYVTLTYFRDLYLSIVSNQILYFALSLSPIAVFYYAHSRLDKMTANGLANVFFIFSLSLGFLISGVYLIYSSDSIILTFGVTSVTFLIMAIYGYTTKTNLMKFSKLIMFALVGIIMAFVINMFLNSTMLDMIISMIGVIVYTFLIAFDTQWIKESIQYDYATTGRVNFKIGLLGAMHLLINFINLFLFLLRFLGDRD